MVGRGGLSLETRCISGRAVLGGLECRAPSVGEACAWICAVARVWCHYGCCGQFTVLRGDCNGVDAAWS